MPFAPYGGVCADDEIVKKRLIEEAISIVRERGMSYIELRNQEEKSNSDFRTDYTYVTFIIPLDSDPDILWRKTAKGARRAVKKALRENVRISMGHEYLDDFYTIYAERNKEFGTPVHSYLFFKHILSIFQDQVNIQVAEKDGKIIGAKFLLFFKDRIISGWAASDGRYRTISPNSLLTWEILRYGCEKGYAFFDFGRSEKDSGTFRFKRAWGGAIIKQLYYQFYIHKTRNLPVLKRNSLKRRIFSNFWRKLPLPMTKVIGPHIRKNLP
ncbi:MAG: peptidoglycan bridge formation protein FemAB [Candidatus Syntrophoarchaeum butanivorans]|uniref:Peptidoglycan bridge formation protein FemAB n=1 Tax=Candidatus Syntropharchaeum butanivorans TaxID=1839936 RepID=A0A1F2P442_9EURY|nr:MAG: peptidoglycan bridge formation protein FemAB [Candidatus Syntrophoarchaeum butanivorans]